VNLRLRVKQPAPAGKLDHQPAAGRPNRTPANIQAKRPRRLDASFHRSIDVVFQLIDFRVGFAI